MSQQLSEAALPDRKLVERRMRRILVSAGRFPHDDAVLASALTLAAMHDAAMTVVHVVELPEAEIIPVDSGLLRMQVASTARSRIGAALTRLGGKAIDIDIRVEIGAPALRLIEMCETLRPGLIVIGAHRNCRMLDRLIGSTPERIIASACAGARRETDARLRASL